MTSAGDPFDLDRFVRAQTPLVEDIEAELLGGRKRTHWMWFAFPQLRGLGHSAMAERYGIASLDEAHAYLAHAVLGPRLRAWTGLVLQAGVSLEALFGFPDDRKFCSCMTLFSRAAFGDDDAIFARALATRCGSPDAATLALLDD